MSLRQRADLGPASLEQCRTRNSKHFRCRKCWHVSRTRSGADWTPLANGTADPGRFNPVPLALPWLGSPNVSEPTSHPNRLYLLDPASQTSHIPTLPLFCRESQDERKLYALRDFRQAPRETDDAYWKCAVMTRPRVLD